MKTTIINIEREVILRIEEQETDEIIYLDFFTKEGLKTIKLRKDSYINLIKKLKGGLKNAN